MQLTLVLGGRRAARGAAIHGLLLGRDAREDTTAADWPFRRRTIPEAAGNAIWIRDLHDAFPADQTPGTRLVLTQSTYQLQRWLDWLDANPHVTLVADANRTVLRGSTPEAAARRGPWSRIAIVDLDGDEPGSPPPSGYSRLQAAFRQPDPELRHDACADAVRDSPENPALHLAYASVCMERLRLDEALDALEHAQALAPDWEAVHFELGKLWLRADETGRAATSFAEACRLMPTFSAALGNLGAALGELDRPDDAIAALEQARRFDPFGHTLINNMGAVWRDTGRLERAEAAFREVIALQPAFVFGYFNLAHTLLLQGRFAEARDTYEAGLLRDAQKNPRQACRLMVARAAAGDVSGAMGDLDALAARVPADVMRDLAGEAESTLAALSAVRGVDGAGVARLIERVRSILRS